MIAEWKTESELATSCYPPKTNPFLAAIAKLNVSASETIQLSRDEADTIFRGVQAMPFMINYSAIQNETVQAYARVNELYEFRVQELSKEVLCISV
jgi:hypothetical protein